MGLAPVTRQLGTRADEAIAASGAIAEQAMAAIRSSRLAGDAIDTGRLAEEVARAGAADPAGAAALVREVQARLPLADQARLQRDLAPAPGTGARCRRPLRSNPVSDEANAVISLVRGDLPGAGLSAVPYLGDWAKVGKLGKWAQTVERAVDLARVDSACARMVRPPLEQLGRTLDGIGPAVLNRMPESVQDFVRRSRAKIAEFLGPPPRMGRAEFDSLPSISGTGARVKPAGGAWGFAPSCDSWISRGGKVISGADGSVTCVRSGLVQARCNSAGYPDFTPYLNHPSGVRSVEVPHSRNPRRRLRSSQYRRRQARMGPPLPVRPQLASSRERHHHAARSAAHPQWDS